MNKILTFTTESGSTYSIFEDNDKNYVQRELGDESYKMRKDDETLELFDYSVSLDEPALMLLEPLSENPNSPATIRRTSIVKTVDFA